MRGHTASERVHASGRHVIAFAALAGALQSACGPSISARNEQGIENVVNRAQFDLDCPRHLLRLAPLQYEDDLVTSYGVIGCGRRGAYVRVPRANLFVLDQNSQTSIPSGGAHTTSTPPKSGAAGAK